MTRPLDTLRRTMQPYHLADPISYEAKLDALLSSESYTPTQSVEEL